MKSYLAFLSVAAFIIFSASCKDDGTTIIECIGGHGGTSTLIIYPEHHGNPIYGATAHLKFNTQSSAGTVVSNYDVHVEDEFSQGHINVEGLRCGSYFIYCAGYDSAYHATVLGGIPFVIEQNQTDEIEVHLPVDEI